MQIVFWCIISIFVMLGIECVIKEIIRQKLRSKSNIILYKYLDENNLEYDLREIMFLYPGCEIYVVAENRQNSPILERFMKDCPNVHIKNMS